MTVFPLKLSAICWNLWQKHMYFPHTLLVKQCWLTLCFHLRLLQYSHNEILLLRVSMRTSIISLSCSIMLGVYWLLIHLYSMFIGLYLWVYSNFKIINKWSCSPFPFGKWFTKWFLSSIKKCHVFSCVSLYIEWRNMR